MSKQDWLVAIFKKEVFDENLERHPLHTFKETYGGVSITGFHGPENELTKLCVELQLNEASRLPSERSLLMLIDKDGIVHCKA